MKRRVQSPVAMAKNKRGNKGKSGASGGAWVYVPAGGKFGSRGRGNSAMMPVMSKFAGGKKANPDQKYLDKLAKIGSELKVWVGGLGKGFSWKKLEKHVEEAVSKPKMVHVYTNGTGCVAMNSEDDVSTVISTLNGSEVAGKTLEVDVWVKKEKKERPEGEEKPKKKKKKNKQTSQLVLTPFGISKQAKKTPSKMDTKISKKLKECDPSLKVWVGGLAAKVDWKKLKDHFTSTYEAPDIVEVMPKGKACVTYETAEGATAAISAVNGTELEGKTLECDVWNKKEKKVKA